MGRIKFQSGDDRNDTPMFDLVLKTSKSNVESARKKEFEKLTALGIEEKAARAASGYYVVA